MKVRSVADGKVHTILINLPPESVNTSGRRFFPPWAMARRPCPAETASASRPVDPGGSREASLRTHQKSLAYSR